MLILINVIATAPIIMVLIFAIGVLIEAVRAKSLHTNLPITDEGCAIRVFMSLTCFIVALVLLIAIVAINKVL